MRAENRRRFISTVILWVLFKLGFTWNIIDVVALWSSVDLRLGRLDCEWTSLAFDHLKTHPKSCSFNSPALMSFKILFHPTYFSENKKCCVIVQKAAAQPLQKCAMLTMGDGSESTPGGTMFVLTHSLRCYLEQNAGNLVRKLTFWW